MQHGTISSTCLIICHSLVVILTLGETMVNVGSSGMCRITLPDCIISYLSPNTSSKNTSETSIIASSFRIIPKRNSVFFQGKHRIIGNNDFVIQTIKVKSPTFYPSPAVWRAADCSIEGRITGSITAVLDPTVSSMVQYPTRSCCP